MAEIINNKKSIKKHVNVSVLLRAVNKPDWPEVKGLQFKVAHQ